MFSIEMFYGKSKQKNRKQQVFCYIFFLSQFFFFIIFCNRIDYLYLCDRNG